MRIIDVNVNRAVEGVRVVEEITRFVLEDKELTAELKGMRSEVRRVIAKMGEREAIADVGRKVYSESEGKRASIIDIFSANAKRVQEALRVLEEFSKVISSKYGAKFKQLRFRFYDLEKRLYFKLLRRIKLDFDLYVVTDPIRDHVKVAKAVIAGGGKALQLRDKTVSKSQLIKWARQIVKLTKKAGVTFIVNDYPDIAKMVDADGVHVGQGFRSISKLRKILGEDKIIGVSVQTLKQAKKAEKEGADYVSVSAIFATPMKKDAKAAGSGTLRQIVKNISIPVVAIGGIDRSNLRRVLATGCQRIAVIRAVLGKKDMRKAISAIRRAMPALSPRV